MKPSEHMHAAGVALKEALHPFDAYGWRLYADMVEFEWRLRTKERDRGSSFVFALRRKAA